VCIRLPPALTLARPLHSARSSSKAGPFSEAEADAIHRGVDKVRRCGCSYGCADTLRCGPRQYGVGKWAEILRDDDFAETLSGRLPAPYARVSEGV